MPFINVKVIEGVFSAQQKSEILRKLTDTMVGIEGESLRGVTWAVLEEVKSGDWAIAGKPLSSADVNALAAAPRAKTG
ncbi:MAG: tautomerase family protein [Steroidobacteraceae bacterium]